MVTTLFLVKNMAVTKINDVEAREIRLSPLPVKVDGDQSNKVFGQDNSPNGEIFLLLADKGAWEQFELGSTVKVDVTPV